MTIHQLITASQEGSDMLAKNRIHTFIAKELTTTFDEGATDRNQLSMACVVIDKAIMDLEKVRDSLFNKFLESH